MKSMRTWFVVAGFALEFQGFLNPSSPAVLAADVTSTWSTATSGNWNANPNWTNVPSLGGFPNNGNGGVATYDAAISPVGSLYTVTLSTDVTIANLLLNSANATLSHTSGILTATGAINLTAGTYSLAGGTIANSTVNAAVPISLTGTGGTLLGVTVNGDLRFIPGFNSKVVIAGGTTFSTAHMAGNYSTIGFAPAQTLGGVLEHFNGGPERAVNQEFAPPVEEVGFARIHVGSDFVFIGRLDEFSVLLLNLAQQVVQLRRVLLFQQILHQLSGIREPPDQNVSQGQIVAIIVR
jgi:hypothetical protein